MKPESIKTLVVVLVTAIALSGATSMLAGDQVLPSGQGPQATEVFHQDFSSSTNVTSYIGKPPGTNQFNAITASEGNTFSIANKALELRLVAPGKPSVITRSAPMVGAPFKLLRFEMTVNYKFTASENDALPFIEFNSAGVNTPWAAPGFQSTELDNEWKVDGSNSGNRYSGIQTIRFYLNNSGSAVTYTAPDGSTESLASGAYDIWVGKVREKDDEPARNPTFKINGFRVVIPHNCIPGTFSWVSFVASPSL